MPAAPAPCLVTGFEPFGGEHLNPAWEVAQALDGRVIGGWPVVARQLPCVFAQSLPALRQALRQLRPRAVLALGLAGSRAAIGIEHVAVNWSDARIPDNAGQQPLDQPVVAGGPTAYFTRLPAKALVQHLQAGGWPAELSLTAGSFVCNQVFYGLMHALRRRPGVPAGFVHLPALPEQAAAHPGGRPLPLAEQVQAVVSLIAALAEGPGDTGGPAVAAGRID